MSWLAKSIANSLKLDDDDDDDYHGPNPSSNNDRDPNSTRPESGSPSAPTVKGDISELTNTLTRQFWGVASFLAPPPDPTTPPAPKASDSAHPSDPEPSEEDVIAGIRSDFAEIGGKFKTGISKLSSNIGVSEFTKIASNLLQFGSEEEAEAAGAALGVTQEVLAFVRNISLHPETWLDFPLSDDDEDSDDFELSDVQQEHALAVERLAPSLAALRIELCPEHMSEAHFWMIYFVLLHPRLSKHDAELLSTPKIVEARGMLSHQLKKGTSDKPETYISGSDAIYAKGVSDSPKEHHLSVPPSAESDLAPPNTSTTRSAPLPQAVDVETDKHPVQSSEIQIIDKPVIEEGPVKETKYQLPLSNSSSKVVDEKYEDDGDDWLKEETSEMDGVGGTSIPIENDEDVSFSDLEDDGDVPSSEIDRLKEELGRVSNQVLHLEQECFELRKEKDKHHKFVSSMTEKKEAAARNSDSTNLSSGIKESGDVLVNHKDSRQFQNALCLSGQPGSRIDIGVSTSKATRVQTDETSASARQNPNDDLSKKLLSIWGSSNDSNEQELGRNIISNLLMDCQTDFLFLFGCIGINRMDKLGDDSSSIAALQYHLHMSHTPEAAKVSHLYSVLTKAKNGMLKLESLFQPLLNLCSLENVIIVQASLHILLVFLKHLVRLERHFERRVNVMVEGLGMKYSYAETQSKNGVWNNGIATWFSNIDWISLFEVILQTTIKNTNQGVRLEAVSVMNMIIMRSNAFVEREKFGQTLVFEILSQLLAKEAGFEARKQAVQLLYMLLNCPKILVKFCSDYKEGKAALAMDDNVGDASGYQKCSMILQGLADCIACCGNSLEELKLRRIAVLLLAFLASSGTSGFEILVSHKLFRDANFLMLILQVLASEVDTEPAVNADQAQIFKERTLLLREALILLNRLVSNPAYSATVLGLLTNSRDMASLTVDVANRLSRKDHIYEKFDGMTRQMRESEIVDLARAFKKRVFIYLGDNIQ